MCRRGRPGKRGRREPTGSRTCTQPDQSRVRLAKKKVFKKVFSHRVVVILVRSNARVEDVLEVVWQGESAHDVTVGVHHAARNWPAVRVSRLGGKKPDVGPGSVPGPSKRYWTWMQLMRESLPTY